MQLADEAVAATGRVIYRRACLLRLEQSCRATICSADTAMTVSGFNRGGVGYENEQQQTNPTPERGAVILKCAVQHARHCRMC